MSEKFNNTDDPDMATLDKIGGPVPAARKKRFGYLATLLAAVAVVALVARREEAPLDVYRSITELQFADNALRNCVTEIAAQHGWSHVGLFTSLRCNNPSGDGIKSLAGIEHMVELTDINLAFNEVSDASALAELPNLTIVDLSHNKIDQLPVFRSAHSLKRVDLNYNLLDSLAWLTSQHFQQLDSLSIAHNHVSDLTEVSLIEGLKELNIRNNRVSDITPATAIPGLFMLDAGANRLNDVSGIGALTELRRLFLDGNRISTLDGLQGLSKLEELSLENNPLHSIAPLAGLEHLQRLNLDRTGIQSLADVLALGDIEWLRVSGNPDLQCESILAAVAEYGAPTVKFDQDCDAAGKPRQ